MRIQDTTVFVEPPSGEDEEGIEYKLENGHVPRVGEIVWFTEHGKGKFTESTRWRVSDVESEYRKTDSIDGEREFLVQYVYVHTEPAGEDE